MAYKTNPPSSETRLGQSAYLDQMGYFIQDTWIKSSIMKLSFNECFPRTTRAERLFWLYQKS